MTRRWIAGAALALFACSSPEFNVRAADSRLSQATLDAVLAWDAALVQGPCPEVRLIPTGRDGDGDIVVTAGNAPAGRRGNFDASASTIVVDLERALEEDLANIVAHELGHALGIPKTEHSANPADLMHHTLQQGRAPAPTGNDVAWVCEHW